MIKPTKEYSAEVLERIIRDLEKQIGDVNLKLSRHKSVSSDSAQLLKTGEIGYVRDDSQNFDLVIRADDGRVYRISGAATASSSSSGSGGGATTDHGSLTGLLDDDHTQYVLRSIMTTKGDLFSYSTVVARLGVGTSDSQLLIPRSSETTGLRWGNLVFQDDEIVSVNNEIVVV